MIREAQDVLYNTEEALRLVDSALRDFESTEDGQQFDEGGRKALERASELLAMGRSEVQSALEYIRVSRAVAQRSTIASSAGQQLAASSATLVELEDRLQRLATLFEQIGAES